MTRRDTGIIYKGKGGGGRTVQGMCMGFIIWQIHAGAF